MWQSVVALHRSLGLTGDVMFLSIFRVLFGFVAACLAAGFVQLAFSIPDEVLTGDTERLILVGDLAARIATHSGVFAAPFALVAAAISEWQSIRTWVYHTLAGLAIAMAGFIALYSSEVAGQPTIINNTALAAYLSAGAVAGFVYWLFSGRFAGDPNDDYRLSDPEVGRES